MKTLREICFEKLNEKKLNEEKYVKRLEYEIEEIKTFKGDEEYFINLYKNGIKYEKNEHNLLIVYLLDIVNDFDMEKEVAMTSPEWP